MLRNTWDNEVEVKIIKIKPVGCFGGLLSFFCLNG